MNKKAKPNNFQLRCPRLLLEPPDTPCQLALAFLENPMQPETVETPGCVWGITSAEDCYCFWKYAQTLDTPVPEKDICNLLNITKDQLVTIQKEAIEHARALKNTNVWKDLRESIHEYNQKFEDNTVYLPDKFSGFLEEILKTGDNTPTPNAEGSIIDEEIVVPSKSKRRKTKSNEKIQRVQLYGLYSDKKLKEIKDSGQDYGKKVRAKNNKKT